jgi:hypothetical protein
MWKRLTQQLRQQGLAVVTALVFAITVVERRALVPTALPAIVLRVDPFTLLPEPPCKGAQQGLSSQWWLN